MKGARTETGRQPAVGCCQVHHLREASCIAVHICESDVLVTRAHTVEVRHHQEHNAGRSLWFPGRIGHRGHGSRKDSLKALVALALLHEDVLDGVVVIGPRAYASYAFDEKIGLNAVQSTAARRWPMGPWWGTEF